MSALRAIHFHPPRDGQNTTTPPADGRRYDELTSAPDLLLRASGAKGGCAGLPPVTDDRSQLARVLRNLIDSGIKYHGSAQQEYSGTGIGPALGRSVVHRHGGCIWGKSGPGKGSVFCFTLPDKSRVSA